MAAPPLYGVYYFLETYGLPVLCPGLRGSAVHRGVSPAGCDRRPLQSGAVLPDVDWFEAHDPSFAAKLRASLGSHQVDSAAYGKNHALCGEIALFIPFRRFAAGALV